MTVWIGLIRAIGPATHAKMSMQDLREGCRAAGLDKVATYIQTGNLLIDSRKSAATVQATVQRVLASFGLTNLVVIRRADALEAVIAADPFPEAAQVRPSEMCVCFLAARPGSEGLARLGDYHGPERLAFVGEDLCVDYPDGVTGSKLMPGAIERRLGVAATARNWNTVRKLLALAQAYKA
ncbi:MAG: DUF1697 domain-containing protein [Rhizobiales bacterium]|nr:DUF1697 domain-containing protein [Hyphomicrobiales bacterium]